MGQIDCQKTTVKNYQHTLRIISEVPRPPEGFCSTECGNNYSKLQSLRHRTSLLPCAGYRSRHNSHSIHYHQAKRSCVVRVLTFPVTDGNVSIKALLLNFVARGPLLTSKNNHGSSHPCSRKYSVRMLGSQNKKKYISALIFERYQNVPVM